MFVRPLLAQMSEEARHALASGEVRSWCRGRARAIRTLAALSGPNTCHKHEPRRQGVSRLIVFQAFGKKSGKMANASIRNLGRLTPMGGGGLSPFGRSARRDARTDSLPRRTARL
jgi:hypothetical protein